MTEKEKGSMVDPNEQQEKEINEKAQMRMANTLEGLSKVVSGIGITLVNVKSAIDGNTEQFKDTADRLNSLVTLLAVGKKINENVETPEIPKTESTKTEPLPPLPQPTTQKPEETKPTSETKNLFPEDLETLLTFEDKGDFTLIKPRQFLGSEKFAKIASIVRGANGEYISAGRDSHFRIPKK